MMKRRYATAREAAFLAILAFERNEAYVEEILEKWLFEAKPDSKDYRLAQEIACGTVRMKLSLDYMAAQLPVEKRPSLNTKERTLLRMAIYQSACMSRVPSYAIVDESVKLAKKYTHAKFAGFLNAVFRKMPAAFSLPQQDDCHGLSIRYSYPEYFVTELIKDYGLEEAKRILKTGNVPPITMVRLRQPIALPFLIPVCMSPSMAKLTDSTQLNQLSGSSNYYIQNATPACLIYGLCERLQKMQHSRILDLCSSPGGKLIAIHDYLPHAKLYANDVSKEKVDRIRQNCEKYGIKAELSCSRGETWSGSGAFDVVILDVPCSNTGVLNKRPEARWRVIPQNMDALAELQMKLLENAYNLIGNDGEIWYMTCSILKNENERLVQEACTRIKMKIAYQKLILPNTEGYDGGFACALVKH